MRSVLHAIIMWKNNIKKAKEFVLDILFPKFCINCGKEGSYLCQDCASLIDITERQYCPFCNPPKIVSDGRTCSSCRKTKKLNGLYSATSYNNQIIKKLVYQFKYSYIKEISNPLSKLIISHFDNLNKTRDILDHVLIPIPLHKKRLKKRGFNQSEEIAKELSKSLGIPVYNNVLIKIKQTRDQTKLKREEREKNVKGAFVCENRKLIHNKKILLVDDIFTTGATMEQGAIALKSAGAKEVWGVVVARGN